MRLLRISHTRLGLMLPLLALAACTDVTVAPVPGCPNLPPACPQPYQDTCPRSEDGTECTRSEPGQRVQICLCDSGIGTGFRYCRDCRCGSRQHIADPCVPGLSCTFGFESGCRCVSPENRFVCCGGVPNPCPSLPPDDGSLCGCIQGGIFGPASCRYGCQTCDCIGNHWQCSAAPPDAGCDGGP